MTNTADEVPAMRCIAIVLLSFCGSFPLAAAPPGNAARECASRLLETSMHAFGFPALSVAVQRRGVPLFAESRGPAHLNYSPTIRPGDRFQVSSTSKILASTLLGILVDQGNVDLDESVRRHVTALPVAFEPLKVRHVFENISALVSLDEIPGALDGSATPRSMLDAIIRRGFVDGMPGERFRYGDAGFFMAQLIIESITGLAYDEAVATHIFEPAGMLDSAFHSDYRTPLPNVVTEYYPGRDGGYVIRDYVFPEYLHAAGGAVTSAVDLLRFDAALMSGRLVTKGTLENVLWKEIELNDGSGVSYARGWDTKDHASGQYSAGHNGGYLSTYRVYWQHDLSVIVLASGYLEEWNPDDLATAFAAVWAPEIVGLNSRHCTFDELLENNAVF